eukprot:Skav227649  [mRNA]  locus=scaffold58:335879:343210:+ [translate_table: standard]
MAEPVHTWHFLEDSTDFSSLTICTFNVLAACLETEGWQWHDRKDWLLWEIRRCEADIVCLQEITLHVRGECSMSKEKLRLCTPRSYTWYDTISTSCDTDYGQRREGCKPPQKRYLGEIFNMYPGTFAAEFLAEVWHFPSGKEPADLNGDPNPASWDPERLLTWFPFEPETCKGAFSPQDWNLFEPVHASGDYAGNMFEVTPLSFATGYRSVFGRCKSSKHLPMEMTSAICPFFTQVFTLHGEKDYAQPSGTFLRNGKALHLQDGRIRPEVENGSLHQGNVLNVRCTMLVILITLSACVTHYS